MNLQLLSVLKKSAFIFPIDVVIFRDNIVSRNITAKFDKKEMTIAISVFSIF